MKEPESRITVAVVDDDPYVRAALKAILTATDALWLIAHYVDGQEVVDASPIVDVMLMDIRMPGMDGIRATEELRRRKNPSRIIMLTTFDDDEEIIQALAAGAAGYLLKDTEPEALVEAITMVARGETILSSSVTRQLIEMLHSDTERRRAARLRLQALSRREYQIADAIGAGRSNSEISHELHLAVPTVKTQISSIFTKLEVTSRLQIALIVRDTMR